APRGPARVALRGAWRERRATHLEERRERGREERRKRRKGVRKGPVRKEGSRREREDARRILSAADRDVAASRPGDDLRESDAGERALEQSAARLALERAGREIPRRPILPTSLRARGARASNDVDLSLPIEKGIKVRVLAGPFANRLGIVQEIDPKNRARVRLGLLVATIDMKDLAASVEAARPLLASSHRRQRKVRER
ncbi:MAG TPA: KOW motif-containing protein, partial [Labilithrix sp.]|nr:KOW motif-containing protein [Labilithrix sp.]